MLESMSIIGFVCKSDQNAHVNSPLAQMHDGMLCPNVDHTYMYMFGQALSALSELKYNQNWLSTDSLPITATLVCYASLTSDAVVTSVRTCHAK